MTREIKVMSLCYTKRRKIIIILLLTVNSRILIKLYVTHIKVYVKALGYKENFETAELL